MDTDESTLRAVSRGLSSLSGWLCLYGPSGAGKSTVGRILAGLLAAPFVDLDAEIEREAGLSIPEIFENQGEAAFRALESAALRRPNWPARAVVALGGGALLDPANRAWVEARGPVVCLGAGLETLLARLTAPDADGAPAAPRPLLQGDAPARLAAYLERRAAHYAAFPLHVDTAGLPPVEVAWRIQARVGWFHLPDPHGQTTGGYDIVVRPGGLAHLGAALQARGLHGPVGLVTDRNVARFHADTARTALDSGGYSTTQVTLPAGEAHKTLESVQQLWRSFLQGGLERRSTAVALGGGVVGDLAGFAAATYLRGMPWVAAPTTLLAMVDASLGGKTGADLPEGKNLVGAFHAPRLVLADPDTLATLPPVELRAGMAEVIKHGIIADPGLFDLCSQGLDAVRDWPALVGQAMAVKVRIVREDPFEQGRRAALNLGHTIGHGVELASGFRLSHGQSIALGMVAEARLAVQIGLAAPELPEQVAACVRACGLPTTIPPDLDDAVILRAISYDKKKSGGKVRFALPAAIGRVETGIVFPDLAAALRELYRAAPRF